MTEKELRIQATEIERQFRDTEIPDEAILAQIREFPETVHAKLLNNSNLFLSAVGDGRFAVAMALSDMGADIHWRNDASGVEGNALNVARSPQDADRLLAMGLEPERNLLLSVRCKNPILSMAGRNNIPMFFYWLEKEKELFAQDEAYLKDLLYAAVEMVSMMNQHNMLAQVIAREELFPILKDIYAKTDSTKSISLYLGALRKIENESLEARKKELRKVLNARKKELTAGK